jgi:hypothetical protein
MSLKKNSSVKDSTKLITPREKYGSLDPPMTIFAIKVTKSMIGIKRNPSFRLVSNPLSEIPNMLKGKSFFPGSLISKRYREQKVIR